MHEQLILYPEFDARIERDYLYRVSVTQGAQTASLPVYNHTEDSRVNRNPVDDNRADEFRRFCSFAFAGSVRVDIRVNRDFESYTVMPARKHFRHSFRDGVISVWLDRPDYFAVRLDGKDHTILAVLADEPETEIPTADDHTIVADGWTEVAGGVLTLTEPHTTVYIPAGAVLNARIRVLADDCRILGRGAIVDPVGDIYRYNAEETERASGGVILIRAVDRTLIDGIHLLDSKAFNIEVIGIWEERWATDNRIRNVKILSTQMSSDGITFCYYARNSLAEHCFVYCGDNALVYEDCAHYRDITIGTTCNALYPQTDVRGSSAEDIDVFRADEGLINATMGGEGGITRLEDHVIRNFSALDITFSPYFLFVEIPGSAPVVTTGEGLLLENIRLRPLKETGTCGFYQTIAAGDYKVTMKNVAIGGKLMRELTTGTVGGEVNPKGQTFRCLTGGEFDPSVTAVPETVHYRKQMNVFVGKALILFRDPVLCEGEDILLPAREMQAELRTDRMAPVVTRSGADCLRAADLTGSGMAKAVARTGNRLTVTPNNNRENLLLPDSGIISKYTEHICYAEHLVVLHENGETILRVINTFHHKSVGIFRIVAEEIRKYGAGTYRLTFEVRSGEEKPVCAMLDLRRAPAARNEFPMHPDWTPCTLDIPVSEAQTDEPKIALFIGGNGECAIEQFDVRNICLVRIDPISDPSKEETV